MKKILIIGIFLLTISTSCALLSTKHIQSTSAELSDYGGYDDYSKATWTILSNGAKYIITSNGDVHADSKEGTLLAALAKEKLWIYEVHYVSENDFLLAYVGYMNDDSRVQYLYKMKKDLSEIVGSVRIPSVNSYPFILYRKMVIIASDFSLFAIDKDTFKQIWENAEFIGTNYHYDNRITIVAPNRIKVTYMHYPERQTQKTGYSILSASNGKLLKQE